MSDVNVTSVLSFRHTTMQCSSSPFTAVFVARYVVTSTAADTKLCCLQQRYLHLSGIDKGCFFNYL